MKFAQSELTNTMFVRVPWASISRDFFMQNLNLSVSAQLPLQFAPVHGFQSLRCHRNKFLNGEKCR
jgi:hypothetical protein